ncbi:MAG: hemin uptake protein HemP [Alcanivorax sp.]|jgi:hemin uptake protein HemP|nr:hemin uptake protein HemP [Alcanivorax sp.]
MTQLKKNVTATTRRVSINAESSVASSLLLNHQGKLWIEHAGERYQLRRTSNNRLILTK